MRLLELGTKDDGAECAVLELCTSAQVHVIHTSKGVTADVYPAGGKLSMRNLFIASDDLSRAVGAKTPVDPADPYERAADLRARMGPAAEQWIIPPSAQELVLQQKLAWEVFNTLLEHDDDVDCMHHLEYGTMALYLMGAIVNPSGKGFITLKAGSPNRDRDAYFLHALKCLFPPTHAVWAHILQEEKRNGT